MVYILPVKLRAFLDALRRFQAGFLPCQAAAQCPVQDSGQLAGEAIGQGLVLASRLDGVLKRNNPDSAPDAQIAAGDLRLVIRAKPNFRPVNELDRLPVQHPGAQRVLAGKSFQQPLCQLAGRTGF